MDSPLHPPLMSSRGVVMRIRAYCTSALVATLTTAFLTATAAAQEPEERGTQATAVGVTVTVKADAWSGRPAELAEVIPLLVTIENNSRVPSGPAMRSSRLPATVSARPRFHRSRLWEPKPRLWEPQA